MEKSSKTRYLIINVSPKCLETQIPLSPIFSDTASSKTLKLVARSFIRGESEEGMVFSYLPNEQKSTFI